MEHVLPHPLVWYQLMSIISHACPPVAFPPPPPTANALSSHQRSALVRSSTKLSKVLGDVPRVLDDDTPSIPSRPSTPSAGLELARTITGSSIASNAESPWHKRKPTHLPPLLRLSSGNSDAPDPPTLVTTPIYRCPPTHRGSVLSIAPSIISNAPSTASGSSTSDVPSEISQRRAKLERLRRKLGEEVPATAAFPTTPHTAAPRTPRASSSRRSPRARGRSITRQTDDARSITFSINSDESVHRVTFSTRHMHSPHPQKTKLVYHTGPLPPVPSITAHLHSGRHGGGGEDDAGLIRPRQKMAAGSKIGGADFKAARKVKREGRKAEPGEFVEMVGFLH